MSKLLGRPDQDPGRRMLPAQPPDSLPVTARAVTSEPKNPLVNGIRSGSLENVFILTYACMCIIGGLSHSSTSLRQHRVLLISATVPQAGRNCFIHNEVNISVMIPESAVPMSQGSLADVVVGTEASELEEQV